MSDTLERLRLMRADLDALNLDYNERPFIRSYDALLDIAESVRRDCENGFISYTTRNLILHLLALDSTGGAEQ